MSLQSSVLASYRLPSNIFSEADIVVDVHGRTHRERTSSLSVAIEDMVSPLIHMHILRITGVWHDERIVERNYTCRCSPGL